MTSSKALLAEVGDVEKVVFGHLHQFADCLDLGTPQAVAGTLRQVESLDRQVEIGAAESATTTSPKLEALAMPSPTSAKSRAAHEESCLQRKRASAGLKRPIGFDVEHQLVEVGHLTHLGGSRPCS